MIEYVGGTVVECNTAYGGARNTTPKHIELMKNTAGLNASTLISWIPRLPT